MDIIIRSDSLKYVTKLKSLAILLEVEDWEVHGIDNRLLVRSKLVEKWENKSNENTPDKLINILKQPALRALRAAESISKHIPNYPEEEEEKNGTLALTSRSSILHIETIGQRKDECTRKSVLNCIADYPAKWECIGRELIGPQLVKKIKQDCLCPGDEAAYMVDEWWKRTTNDFSWSNLQTAITSAFEYRPIDYDRNFITSARDKRRFVQVAMDIEDLREEFGLLQIHVKHKLRERYTGRYSRIKERLINYSTYEPHYEEDLRYILGKRRIKSIDKFFEKIHRCWNFLDIGLMKILIKLFIRSHTVRHKLKKYSSKLNRFKQTPIALVIRALMMDNSHPRMPSNDHQFQSIIQKLDLDPNKLTLEKLDDIRTRQLDKLRDLGLLQTSLMVFHNAEFSCVLVTWLVRVDHVMFFEKMFEICETEGTFLNDDFIVSVKINDRIYQTKEWALLEASSAGDVKKVNSLLQNWMTLKHNINQTDGEGKNCLIRAAEQGHTGVVALLLEHKAVKIDYQMPGKLWSALFFAHFGGHFGVVKLLEEYGANTELEDKEGKIAKAISTIQEKHEQKMPSKSKVGDRLFSAMKKIVPVLKKLEKKKIHALCENGDFEEVKKLILSKAVEIDVTDGYPRNWTPLMCACYGGHYDIVNFLLERGADINIKSTKKDWTALHIAAVRKHLRITNLLLRKGACPNDIIDQDNIHLSVLMYIANMDGSGYVEIARTLLNHGADVELPNKLDDETALFSAASGRNEALVELLLEYHADCNRLGHKGWSPLMEAARSSAGICKILIDHGANTDLAMQAAGKVSGDTALHVACYYGKADVVSALVAGGADPNKENEVGLTPLMIATKRNHVGAINSLAESKLLDIDHLHVRTGLSAVFVAASSGHIDVCQALLKHGASPDIDSLSIMECIPRRHKNKLRALIDEYKSEVKPPRPAVEVPTRPDIIGASTVEVPEKLREGVQVDAAKEQMTPDQESGQEDEERESESHEAINPIGPTERKIPIVTEVESHIEEGAKRTAVEDIVEVEDSSVLQISTESLPDISVSEMTEVERTVISAQDNMSSECPESTVADVSVEEPVSTDEPKEEDDDDSLYGDGEDTKRSLEVAPSGTDTLKEEKLRQHEAIINQWKRMTPAERMKLMDNIINNYFSNINYPGSGTNKGVQQPQVPSFSPAEVYATGT